MKKIKLFGVKGEGKFAIVDNKDYKYLIKKNWSSDHYGYAVSSFFNKENKKWICTKMHRLITNCPKGLQVDHINHNPLDNRRSNLRIVTKEQNQMNQKIPKTNTSGYKGVSWSKQKRKWIVKIKRTQIGSFEDKLSAAFFYDKNVRKIFGEYAWTNFS